MNSELICSLSIYNKNNSKEEFFIIDSSVTIEAFKKFVKNNYTQSQESIIKSCSGKIISSTEDLQELFAKSAKNRQVFIRADIINSQKANVHRELLKVTAERNNQFFVEPKVSSNFCIANSQNNHQRLFRELKKAVQSNKKQKFEEPIIKKTFPIVNDCNFKKSSIRDDSKLFNELYKTVARRNKHYVEPKISRNSFPIIIENPNLLIQTPRARLFSEMSKKIAENSHKAFVEPAISQSFPIVENKLPGCDKTALFNEMFKRIAENSHYQFEEPVISQSFPIVEDKAPKFDKTALFNEMFKRIAENSHVQFEEPEISKSFPVVEDKLPRWSFGNYKFICSFCTQ